MSNIGFQQLFPSNYRSSRWRWFIFCIKKWTGPVDLLWIQKFRNRTITIHDPWSMIYDLWSIIYDLWSIIYDL
jgi:hypothetical protein